MKRAFQVTGKPRFVSPLFVMLVASLLVTTLARGRISHASPTRQSEQTPEERPASAFAAQSFTVPCPPAGLPIAQPSARGVSHHKVTLSWNASPPAANSGTNAIGYCLYRSKTNNAAKQKPTCSQCEPINSVPVRGSSCVDDIVSDSTTYFYVVAAINARGTLSSSSNEIQVQIPGITQTNAGPAGLPVPACRGTYLVPAK